jgi:hypothetical protein
MLKKAVVAFFNGGKQKARFLLSFVNGAQAPSPATAFFAGLKQPRFKTAPRP